MLVNEILGDHNVDKQITDNKGDVAYLMADVSDVSPAEIKEIFENLEALQCKCHYHTSILCSELTIISSDHDPNSLLVVGVFWVLVNGGKGKIGYSKNWFFSSIQQE